MTNPIKFIMLIDDNGDDNFFHERVIRKSQLAEKVMTEQSPVAALEYLRQPGNSRPDLIFVDINMPGMDGWEFLEEYSKLDEPLRTGIKIIMLTTSENPDDEIKASKNNVGFRTKPLTREMLQEFIDTFFKT